MPTPSTPSPPPHEVLASVIQHRSIHTTCPPDDDRTSSQIPRLPAIDTHSDRHIFIDSSPVSGAIHIEVSNSAPRHPVISRLAAHQDLDSGGDSPQDSPSPASTIDDVKFDENSPSSASPVTAVTPFSPPFSPLEAVKPKYVPRYTSSHLRAGSIFQGTQQSDRQVYNVQVELKHVDIAESFMCGYLRIEGLTSEHPTLTTYFEGEIIGNKYSFLTNHNEWGSNEKVDMQHWNRFPAWRPLQRQARKTDFNFNDFANREHLFMRWKEYFLVPDHKVRTISGASFEGFYYICFNQVSGTVSGIYFHSKSEKYQQLELKHVDNHGCAAAMEFR